MRELGSTDTTLDRRFETMLCKYHFTEEEKRDLAEDLARLVAEHEQADEEKRAVAKTMGARTGSR